LSRGQILYYGPGDKMVPYFSDLGYQCPTYTNPSDYFSEYLFVYLVTCDTVS